VPVPNGPTDAVSDALSDADALVALAAPPHPPLVPARFSSNTLFGEPGIYPDAPHMIPAFGDDPSEDDARALIGPLGDAARARYDDATLRDRVPAPLPRAGLAALSGTVGEPLLDAFIEWRTDVTALRVGAPAAPGRVVGPAAQGDRSVRLVNARYRAEHPVLLAPSLTHDLLWSGPGAGQNEEVVLHALCAVVHVQLVARHPFVADLGSELARRQNSLAIALLNSRHPGSPDVSLIAPDGPGTIPGGAESMQTPDFWSIPFVRASSKGGDPQETDAPELLGEVLARIAAAGTDSVPSPLRYDDALGAWLSAGGLRGALSPHEQYAAAVALGLLP
jgi:hypothetical protein